MLKTLAEIRAECAMEQAVFLAEVLPWLTVEQALAAGQFAAEFMYGTGDAEPKGILNCSDMKPVK